MTSETSPDDRDPIGATGDAPGSETGGAQHGQGGGPERPQSGGQAGQGGRGD